MNRVRNWHKFLIYQKYDNAPIQSLPTTDVTTPVSGIVKDMMELRYKQEIEENLQMIESNIFCAI